MGGWKKASRLQFVETLRGLGLASQTQKETECVHIPLLRGSFQV